jgi:hypothetical protein
MVAVMIVPASAALAADATGCQGTVASRLADGTPLDKASAPGEGGTASDPFVIDPQGSVAWEGTTDAVITGGSWTVRVGFVPVMSGTADNAEGKTSAEGVVDLGDALAPVQWILQTNALIPVDGELTGTGGTCSGSGYIAGTGGGTFTSPVFLAGAGVTALGAILALGVIATTKATALTAAAQAASAAGGAS